MILKVSNRRYRQLTQAERFAKTDPALAARIRGDYTGPERRELVRGGHAQPTAQDVARMERAEAKRQAKGAKRARPKAGEISIDEIADALPIYDRTRISAEQAVEWSDRCKVSSSIENRGGRMQYDHNTHQMLPARPRKGAKVARINPVCCGA